jgi:ribulose 1,5-bisphosphate synthetase/thiazole synthase
MDCLRWGRPGHRPPTRGFPARSVTMRKNGLMPHIVITGVGIPGVTSAYELNKRGYDVTVIERERHPATNGPTWR